MAIEGKFTTVAVVAGTDLRALEHRILSVDGTLAEDTDQAIGALKNLKPNSGGHGSVAIMGHVKLYAGAAINSNASLMVASGGFAIAQTSGWVSIGKAMTGASSGDLFDAVVNFVNAGQIL